MIPRKATALFLILTFGLAYSLAGMFKLAGARYEGINATILGVVYMFTPLFAAVVVTKIVLKENVRSLLVSLRFNKWFTIAWLLPPVISFCTIAVSLLFQDVIYSPEMAGMKERFEDLLSPEQMEQMEKSIDQLPVHPLWLSLLQGLIAGATINAVAAFGEELGWRGFLLKGYQDMHFTKASLVIGLIWGLWHAPLILMGHNYPEHPYLGVLMMVAWCILLTPFFLYVTIMSQSVIAASIMHGTLNATAGIAIMVIQGGNDLTVGLTGLAGFVSIGLFLSGLYIYDTTVTRQNIMRNPIRTFLLNDNNK